MKITYGQEYIKPTGKFSSHQRGNHSSQKIGIFEVSKKSQIDSQTQSHQPFAFPASFGTVHPLRQQEVANRDQRQQEKSKCRCSYNKSNKRKASQTEYGPYTYAATRCIRS